MSNKVTISNTTNQVTITPQDVTSVSVGTTNTPITVNQGSTSVVQVISQGPQGPQGPQGSGITPGVDIEPRNITASGNISASGNILGTSANFPGSSADSSVVLNLGQKSDAPSSPLVQVYTDDQGDDDLEFHVGRFLSEVRFTHTSESSGADRIKSVDIKGSYLDGGSIEIYGKGGLGGVKTTIGTSINTTGNITASGNISASGDLVVNTITASGNLTFDGSQNITTIGASDAISITPQGVLNLGTSNADSIRIGRDNDSGSPTAGRVEIFANSSTTAAVFVTESITFNHPITASGNISASGDIRAKSFIASGSNGTNVNPAGFVFPNPNNLDDLITNRITLTSAQNMQFRCGSVFQFANANIQILGGNSLGFKNETNIDNIFIGNNAGAINSSRMDFFSGSAPNITTFMSITSSGNVGIGTTAPIQKLDVIGDARATNFRVDSTNKYIVGNGNQYMTGTNDTALELYSGGSSRVYISSSGNVGIGTTDPSQQLEVRGNIQISGSHNTSPQLEVKASGSGATKAVISLNTWRPTNGNYGATRLYKSGSLTFLDTDEDFRIRPNANGAFRVSGGEGNIHFMSQSGANNEIGGETTYFFGDVTNRRIGIGTTSPSQKLEVSDGFMLVTGSGASGYGYLLDRAGSDRYEIRHLDGGLTIRNATDDVKEMTFDGTGKVGIGTTTPGEKLEVVGTIAASGSLVTTKTGSVTDPALHIKVPEGSSAGNNAGIIAEELLAGSGFYVPYFVSNNAKIFGFGTIMSMEVNLDMQTNKIYFDQDSANTYIASNADDPEDLEIHADQDIILAPDNKTITDFEISGSNTGSFKHLKLDYDSMPTSNPNIKGVVYRNGSNQLFISQG